MSIYRKLKSYIYKDPGDEDHCASTTSIFGTLHDSRNVYFYKDEEDEEWKEYNCKGTWFHGEMEHLLNYYVVGIWPRYEIINDRIVLTLGISLKKEKPEL